MKLLNHVQLIRVKIEQSLDNRFSRMGFKAGEELDSGIDNAQISERRNYVRNIIAIHEKSLNNYVEARKEALNECVFTLYNRLAAIKVMEAREIFPEVIRTRAENGNLSFAHNAWLENHPEERDAERMGLKHFLLEKFEELGETIPLYRSDYPYSLMPTADDLHEILSDFNAIEEDPDVGGDIWLGDDILGWQYENFNTAEKLALKASGDKTEYDKVSLQSQVYTPRWVVKFLVDNSLGKLYLEMFPDSDIVKLCDEKGNPKYLIANAPEKSVRDPKPLEELKLIDPACGSGNFLIYAFTLFYDLYLNQIDQYGAEYARRDIPRLIVENNLYGVDLDERAVQLTQIAMMIKARELGGRRADKPSKINVVSSHFSLPDYKDVEMAFLMDSNWDIRQREVIESIWNDLRNAHKFGSLVRVEEKLKEMVPASDPSDLFREEHAEGDKEFLDDVMNKLYRQVRQAVATESSDYSKLQVNNALSFLQIISNKYDVAVANPPYTDSSNFGNELKEFVDENYSKPYKVNINLYATFIKRCCELTGCDGKIAMIHPMTFMYIKTFEDTRKFILDNTHINLFVEYGLSNLFGSIMVDPAFYVLDKTKSISKSVFISLDQYTRTPQEKFKKNYCLTALKNIVAGDKDKHVYRLPQAKLKEIKSWPFIYWISDEFREKFKGQVLEQVVGTKKGMDTCNNERFLRFWWEINKSCISVDYKHDGKKWVSYAKGGPFNKWYGNFWLTVNWINDGYDLKHFTDDKGKTLPNIRNEEFYFHEGITYSAAGTKGTTFRYMPKNMIIDSGGPGIYLSKFNDIYYILALLNSILAKYIFDCLNPTVNTTHGDIRRIPFIMPNSNFEVTLCNAAKQCVSIKRKTNTYSIIEINYAQSPITSTKEINDSLQIYYNKENALLTQILLNEAIDNKIIFDVYALTPHDRQMVLDKEGIPVGDLSVSQSAKESYQQWLEGNTEFPASEELKTHIENLEVNDDQPQVTDFDTLYQSNNGWEEFCKKHKMNPIEVWYQFKNAGILPPQRTHDLAFELITDVIRTVLAKDDDGVIPLSVRIGEDTLSARIEQELNDRSYSAGQISQLITLLGGNLDTYLRDHFFQELSDYLNLFMYLPKTPFIWHLTTGSHHALDVFVSIYKWNRNTLTRIKSVYAANRDSQLRDRLMVLEGGDAQQQMEAGEVRARIAEITGFVERIDDLLASGYDPKLDDGVGKNIAPLQQRGLLSYEVLNPGQLKKYLKADW